MNVSTASALIGQYVGQGLIDMNTAARAQRAVRETSYYGNRMTGEDRRRILNLRFGIVDTVTPVAALLQRAAGA